jgi:hypothetical protein
MWQSPAIFLQHAISNGVICVSGRQASAGMASQTASKLKTAMERQRTIITGCYPHLPSLRVSAQTATKSTKSLTSGTHGEKQQFHDFIPVRSPKQRV